MAIFKIHHEQAGGHVHCALFVAKSPNMTYAKCGDFCVSAGEEFEELQRALSGVAFVARGKPDEAIDRRDSRHTARSEP